MALMRGTDDHGTRMGESPSRRWILYFFCFLTMSTVAGVVYGWPALRKQLQRDGSDLDESELGAIFTVGAWSTQGGRFFVGLARDRFGTRRVTSICILFVALGSVGVAWSDPSNVLSLSFSLFSLGLGSGAQLCVQPVAGLFPNTSGTVLASLSGAFQISGMVFLALTSGMDNVGTRKARFSAFAIFMLAMCVGAMILLPNGKSFLLEKKEGIIVDNDDGLDEESCKETDSNNFGGTTITTLAREGSSTFCDNKDPPESKEANDKNSASPQFNAIREDDGFDGDEDKTCKDFIESQEDADPLVDPHVDADVASARDSASCGVTPSVSPPTAFDQMKSAEYIMLCLWFSVCLIPLQYYVGSIGFQLEDKGDDDGFYTDLFSIIYAGVIVFSPVGGYVSDRVSLGFTQGLATIMCAGSFFFLASTISLKGQTVGLVFYGTGRLLIFAMYFANCGNRFGYANFGTLAGFGLLVSALASLLQYPMISAAANGYSRAVNIGSGAALMAQLPYFLWLHHREKMAPHKQR